MSEAITGLELRSTVTSGGKLVLNLEPVTVAAPGPDEVVVRIEAAPINPSDLGLLLGPADMSTLVAGGTPDRPTLTADIPAGRMPAMKARLDESMAVGNEGAGTVIAAGENAAALLGKKVGMIGGAMYATHRKLAAQGVMPLPEGATAADGASMFVNPLTSLMFVETMRAEGHKAIVHTAAASNLGQMLNRICLKDGVPLVNIVRSAEQAEILREIGATIILDSNAADFQAQLMEACAATGATIAFDAIGGGTLANRILHAMEAAASRGQPYSRYGSSVLKQVYVYGMLDTGLTTLDRQFGLSWSVSGWLLTPFLMKAGMETGMRLRARVSDELTTTFASNYTATIGLAEALKPEVAAAYQRKATGEKYLIDPSFRMLKLFAISVACLAAAGPQVWANLQPIPLKAGSNTIANIAGDGKPGTITLDWRDNGNAWGYDIFTVKVGGSIATVEDRDRFTDSPHTGEDMITSVRFARGRYEGLNTTFALVANRVVATSVPAPAQTTIKIYVLKRNDSGLGTPYEFLRVTELRPSRLYCNADKALQTELGFPLASSYSGAQTVDGCW